MTRAPAFRIEVRTVDPLNAGRPSDGVILDISKVLVRLGGAGGE